MFPFGHNPHAQAYRGYDPYEELLQQELQRRRQAEEYHRRRQLEELNRRRAEQLEYARRQAEIQRLREAEARRLHQLELEARRRKLSEPAHARTLCPRIQEPAAYERDARGTGGRPQSMLDGGIQDLFDALYGGRGHPNSLSPSSGGRSRRSKSSDPPRQPTNTPALQTAEAVAQSLPTEDSAVSDTEDNDPIAPSQPASKSAAPEVTVDGQPEADTTKAHSAISDILKSFSGLKAGFSFPDKLDFLSTPGDVTVTAPKLAYTPNNAPLHQYEHLLTGLLTKLDAVESYGQESIRRTRKDVVKQIERELEELDVKKLQEWRRQSEEATTTNVPVITTSEPPQESPKEASAGPMRVGPASIPHDNSPELRFDNETRIDSPSQHLGLSSSSPLATPLVRPSDLKPPSDNAELVRGATPTPSEPNPSLASGIGKRASDIGEVEPIEEGYVDVGRGSTGSDTTDDEPARGRVDPDDSWEVEL